MPYLLSRRPLNKVSLHPARHRLHLPRTKHKRTRSRPNQIPVLLLLLRLDPIVRMMSEVKLVYFSSLDSFTELFAPFCEFLFIVSLA